MSALERFSNLKIFIKHVQNVQTLRKMLSQKGDHFSLFGGTACGTHAEVRALMEREPEKVDIFCGPLADRADYLTKNYVPFLQMDANHAARREHILMQSTEAQRHLGDLETLLKETNPTSAILKFMFRHLVGLELSEVEVEMILFFRKWGAPLTLLPKWMRTGLLGSKHRELTRIRSHFLDRFAATGIPFSESYFDVLWFNSATLPHYAESAVKYLKQHPDVKDLIESEADLEPRYRVRTRALVMEMVRLECKIASVNYRDDDAIKIALIVTAVVDPQRYENPLEVKLDRDYSDSVSFAGPSPHRSCPGMDLSLDIMSCVVANSLRQR
jgi:hypothetical protein